MTQRKDPIARRTDGIDEHQSPHSRWINRRGEHRDAAAPRVTEQVDALESMSLSPFRYLMVPNLLAGIISFPLLASIFNSVGIYGGYVIGVKLLGLSPGTYFSMMENMVELKDITDGLIKSLCFGVIVIWVSSYQGYYTRHGAEGVSRATTTAVVMSSTLVLVWDYFLDTLMI